MKVKTAAAAIIIFLSMSCTAYAETPTETIKKDVEKVLEVLRDPKFKSSAEKAQRLEELYSDMFNEVELAKRTLTYNWNKLTNTQRREFVGLYRQLLEKAYIDRILDYSNEKVVYNGAVRLSENRYEVRTTIVTSSKEIPINYRVIQTDGEWKIYDVVIENVSLVQNYRSQFNDILTRNTPEQMLQILRKRDKGK